MVEVLFPLLFIDLLWWGEIRSQNCNHQRSYFHPPGDNVSMESQGDYNAAWVWLLTRPPEVSGITTSRDIWGK
jgi:hypothetical protein